MFDITKGKGFKLTFANGWTVSVQFGGLNYCQHYNAPDGAGYRGPSKDAEVAAWDKDGNWHKFDNGDTVCGWCGTDDVANFIALIAAR